MSKKNKKGQHVPEQYLRQGRMHSQVEVQSVRQTDDGKEGLVTAIITRLEVLDSFYERIMKGAIGVQHAVILGSHNWEVPSLGKAVTREDDEFAYADMKFNLDMQVAADWFSSIYFDFTNGESKQEYSWGYRILRKEVWEDPEVAPWEIWDLIEVDLFEVSPVVRGVSIDTGTVSVRSAGQRYATSCDCNSGGGCKCVRIYPGDDKRYKRQLEHGGGSRECDPHQQKPEGKRERDGKSELVGPTLSELHKSRALLNRAEFGHLFVN